jgi:hypothetical protein
MEILSDRIGVLLKFGKVLGSLTKRYFFIDNNGILYYTDKEQVILNMLKHTNYDNKLFVSLISPHSKAIDLQQCSISQIKPYLENNFDLQGRSYFELILKSRDYRSIAIFGYKDEFTKVLYDYISSFKEPINNNYSPNKDTMLSAGNNTGNNFLQKGSSSNKDNNTGNSKEQKSMDEILLKLGSTFVNQKEWQKPKLSLINPSSQEPVYEETWAELENGSNYSGPVKNGMPHGYGKEYRPDGSLYTGNFFEGKWQGTGTITTDRLDTYTGEFIDGCICGI